MGRLFYSAIASLDGYTEDAGGSFAWAAPDEEVHAFVNAAERPIGTYLYGRRMYLTMAAWETLGGGPDASGVEREYAQIWRAADKVVFSHTLDSASTARTRIEPELTRELVADLKQSVDHDLSIGGPELAAQALRWGLVDEVGLLLHPLTVGGGKPALPADLRLRLIDQGRFGCGVVRLRYAVERDAGKPGPLDVGGNR